MERQAQRQKLPDGVLTVGSRRGSSSHHHNPFVILAAPETSEDYGECLGAMLVYSGSYRIDIERTQMRAVRMVLGIQDEQFQWELQKEEQFVMPI